jgi:hypothetical protein
MVTTEAEVEVASAPSGAELRDAYAEALPEVTFGLVALRDNTVRLGPLELLRFGQPLVTADAVEWAIEGGLLARRPGGRWRIDRSGGRVTATVTGYTPRLPRPIYDLTHLQVHQLFTRLYLLRLRGREPAPGPRATPGDRRRAALIDVAFCFTLAGLTGRPRRRLRRTLAIAAAYHIACWSVTGRTLGGLVMRQRVVAVDGSRLTPTQSVLRLAAMPLSWFTGRAVHDELASTEVIAD